MKSVERVVELYNQGGFSEVLRGVRDWSAMGWSGTIISKCISQYPLSVGEVEVTILVDCREDFFRATGHGELDIMYDFVQEIRPSDIVWDVGANIGTYSLLAAKVGAQVEAFEPGRDACKRLNANAEVNNVTINVHNYALSDEDGTAILTSGTRSGVRKLSDGSDGDIIPVRRGDTIDRPEPDIVKIDVEGAEEKVIRGMRDCLNNCRLVFVEVHGSERGDEVTRMLNDLGFDLEKEYTEFNNPILRFA